MNENNSRKARKRAENRKDNNSSGGVSKVFYWVIGILFLILIGLMIFLFSQSGDDVNLSEENNQTAVTEEPQNEEPDDDAATVSEDPEESSEEPAEEPEDETDEAAEEDENEEPDAEDEENTEEPETETEDEDVTVNEDAPLNEGYAVDYSDGSSDRLAIKNQVMQATGLGDDLIEWWVGNNGPGRVEATVSSRDQTEVYRVYLQYGDGSWHVTSYESLPEVPANLR